MLIADDPLTPPASLAELESPTAARLRRRTEIQFRQFKFQRMDAAVAQRNDRHPATRNLHVHREESFEVAERADVGQPRKRAFVPAFNLPPQPERRGLSV